MKYVVTFSAGVREPDGPTNISWYATHEVEVEHLSGLIPLMSSVERVVQLWRTEQTAPEQVPLIEDLRGISTAGLRREWHHRKAQGLPGTEDDWPR